MGAAGGVVSGDDFLIQASSKVTGPTNRHNAVNPSPVFFPARSRMSFHSQDPIIAIATAPGRGAVGIVRLSGADLSAFVQALLGRELPLRVATLVPFPDAAGQPLDRGLAIHFQSPNSYTGEDVLELQAHGGPVILKMLVERCLAVAAGLGANGLPVLPGLRLAEPGEFTERAFLNDKLDLAQAEAVADLIDASTEAAARSAARSMTGVFSGEVQAVAEALTTLRMLVEATLDFPDEEIDFLERDDARGQIARLLGMLDTLTARTRQGVLLHEGVHVVIAGQPNAGKSSLLNALAGTEVAIVTDVAGTTRDRLGETLQIEGVPVHIIDTAGLRETEDPVERIGVARAWEAVASADAVLFLHDLSRIGQKAYDAAEEELRLRIQKRVPAQAPIIEVYNKADLISKDLPEEKRLAISAMTGDGLPALRQSILGAAGWQALPEGTFMARERHLRALAEARSHMAEAQKLLGQEAQALDLVAEELRLAQQALGAITGEVTSDDLLGVIFSRFCIGK